MKGSDIALCMALVVAVTSAPDVFINPWMALLAGCYLVARKCEFELEKLHERD